MLLFLQSNDPPGIRCARWESLQKLLSPAPSYKAQRRDTTCPRQRKIKTAASWALWSHSQLDGVSATTQKQTRVSPALPEPDLPAPEWTSHHSLPPEMLRGKGWGKHALSVKVYVLGLSMRAWEKNHPILAIRFLFLRNDTRVRTYVLKHAKAS